MDRRISQIGLVLLFLFGALFLQLNNLQVLQAKKLANAPGNVRQVINAFSLPRGAILTGDGKVIAESKPVNDAYHYLRVYPYGTLYGDVTGFYSIDYGVTGIEAAYNKYLTGHSPTIRSLTDLLNSTYVTDSVTTTISSTLQSVAESALGNRKGAAVVIQPSTGAILAMVSNPGYDPTPLASHSGATEQAAWKSLISNPNQPLLNRAISRAYPPGSSFKIVTTSAVYDHDPSIASINFPAVTQIPLPLTTHTLHNYAYESCGGTIPLLLKVSCDTGYAQVGLKLGAANLSNEAASFGFNQIPPLDIGGAAASTFPPASFFNRNLPQLAYSAIGQGNVSATALQMAMVGAAVANGGLMMAPHLMYQIRNSQDQVIKQYQPKVYKVATSPSTASIVTSEMEGVVQGGTASGIAIPGVKIAAKTGTAQTTLGTGSTISGADNWMVAFAPANAPTIAVAVVVPKQAGLVGISTGATQAGPVVKAILQAALGVG